MKKLLTILAMLLLGIFNSYPQEKTLLNIYMSKGEESYNKKDFTTAVSWYNKAVEYIDENPIDGDASNSIVLAYLAPCYEGLGDYLSAIECYNRSINIINSTIKLEYPQVVNEPFYIVLFTSIADCYRELMEYDLAIEILHKVLDRVKNVWDEKENHGGFTDLFTKLAHCYGDMGDDILAMEYYKYALEISNKVCGINSVEYARALCNVALCHINIGAYDVAIKLLEQSIVVDKSQLEIPLEGLARCYLEIGNHKYANKVFKQATKISKRTFGCHKDYAMALANRALYYCRIGKYHKSLKLNKRSCDIIKNELGEDNRAYAHCLNNVAIVQFQMGHYASAIDISKHCVDILNANGDKMSMQYVNALAGLCSRYYGAGQYNDILSSWADMYISVKCFLLSGFREMTSTQRQTQCVLNVGKYVILPNSLYSKVLSNNNQSMGLSYNSLLFSKGVILATDIEFDRVIRESGDTVLLEKFEELRTTRAILNTYYNKPIAERPEGEVERLEARAEVLEKDLLAGSKEYADFTRRLEIEWEDVQTALGDKDVAIEILAAEELIDEDTPPYYAALVLRKGWDAPKFVELCGADELQAYFDSENGLAIMYREANSRKLYDLIWGKLAEYINEGDNVYFSPGGLLHQVNVELLQDVDGRLANEKYNLHRVSSTRELCFEKPKIAHSEAVLYGGLRYDLDSTTMIAQSRAVRPEEEFYAMRGLQLDSLRGKLNYLSASKTEVEEISEQMNQHGIKTTLYVEQVGNEESFKALSGKKTPIIHLATHGFFFRNEEVKVKPFFRMMSMDQERPRPDNSLRRSGLAFAGAQKAWDGEEIPRGIDDGVMLAQEIASMDLAGTDLVVLSACETGLGEINSEGVFGLQRAFKKAGVQTLVMSLWKVHDEATALFMQTFYDNLLLGKSKRESFATAQMALREHRDYGKDPAYWAAFVMLD